jgi:hypothetical protein
MLAALIVVAAVAVRGSLPGAAPPPPDTRPAPHPAAAVLVVALLAVSLVLIAVAVLARIRDPRASVGVRAGWSDRYRGHSGRTRWRPILLILALGVAWLLVVALLSRWGMPRPGTPPAPPPASTTMPTSPPAPAPAPRPSQPEGDLSAVVYAAAVGFLALVALGSVVTARRTRRPAPAADPRPDEAPTAHPAIATESLARAAEVGLAEVGDTNREPRAAIIACYAAMESELALVPAAAPRDFDTASEVLARAVEYGALRYDSATQLVELFEEARFSPHVMSEAHRDTAVRVLRLALAELRGGT